MHGTPPASPKATLDPLEQPIVKDVWRDKYQYLPTESDWAGMCSRIVRALCGRESAELQIAMGTAMRAREIVPAGRILAGAGTPKRVTLINCFVSPDIQDSMRTDPDQPGSAGIMHALSKAAYTQQMGGGIGMDFSTIRPRGAVVKRTNSVSSGVLPFMDMWNAMCATIRSSGSRRGAMMATLGVWHPDLLEFISAKHEKGRLTNFNVSVLVTDEFMEAVRDDAMWHFTFPVPPAKEMGQIKSGGKVTPDNRGVFGYDGGADPGRYDGYIYGATRAREVWQKIIESTYVYAEPGVIFIDRVNQQNNLAYCEYIHCTNPCFTGDTLVWTMAGPRRFDELAAAGSPVPVLTQLADGRLAFRDMVRPRRTRRGAKLVEVTLRGSGKRSDSFTTVRCTPDHVFFLRDGTERRARDLQPQDSVASVYRTENNKGYLRLTGTHEAVQEHWVVAEFALGRRPDYPREHVHHKNDVKADNRPENLELLAAAEHNALNMRGDLNPVRRVPECNHFARTKFGGEKNGMFGRKHSAATRAKIGAKTRERNADPEYKERWRASVGSNHRVVSVRELEEREDVYCGTVAETGRFFVWCGDNEGVLVSNCGEQPLPANGDCNLGHTNLAVMVDQPFTAEATFRWDKLRKAAGLMVNLLDRVLDVTQWPLEEQAAEARAKRRVGLGFTGLASALQQLGIAYGSPEAQFLTADIARTQAVAAYEASIELAAERGAFPMFDREKYGARPFVQKVLARVSPPHLDLFEQHGIRNGVLLSIAPTGTTSLVIGNVSSGIEPVFAHAPKRLVRDDNGNMAKSYAPYDYSYLLYCAKHGLDPDAAEAQLPDYFVTAADLTVEQHLLMASAAQAWIDAAVSKTINCPTSMTTEEFEAVYHRAYELGMKGCTTYRPDPRSGRGAVLEEKKAEPRKPVPPKMVKMKDAGQLDRGKLYMHDPSPAEQASGWIKGEVSEFTPPPLPEKLPMQEVADGRRYRIKWPSEDCAYYVVITDCVVGGKRRPFELFISTKSERHSEWVKAFSLLVTAIFRREGDPSFVVDELRSVFAATGGTWIKVPWADKPKLATSLVAAIGLKIEEHMRHLGMITPDDGFVQVGSVVGDGAEDGPASETMPAAELLDVCDGCGARAVIYQEGCAVCHACGRSDCG